MADNDGLGRVPCGRWVRDENILFSDTSRVVLNEKRLFIKIFKKLVDSSLILDLFHAKKALQRVRDGQGPQSISVVALKRDRSTVTQG